MIRSARLAARVGLLLCAMGSSTSVTLVAATSAARVSVIRLIGAPGSFDGERVRVAGYCHLQYDGDALYLHREDHIYGLASNALVLDLGDIDRRSMMDRSDRYVIVEGTFVARELDDIRSYAGTLRVATIEVLPVPDERPRRWATSTGVIVSVALLAGLLATVLGIRLRSRRKRVERD